MQDWDAWRCVLLIARHGTIAAAAAHLGVDPTTAARRLRRLERGLGNRLFERQGAHLLPTRTCADLLPRLEEAEVALRAAENDFAPPRVKPLRSVRITAVSYIVDDLLVPGLSQLQEQCRMRVELIADNRNFNLNRREADLAVRLARPETTGGYERLGELGYAVYARRGIEPESLDWANLDDGFAHLEEVKWVAQAAGVRTAVHKASLLATLQKMAAVGQVRVLLPELVGEGDERLARCGPRGVMKREAWLLWHPEDVEQPHLKTTMNWIRDLFLAQNERRPRKWTTAKGPSKSNAATKRQT